jgi:hypothetical protein
MLGIDQSERTGSSAMIGTLSSEILFVKDLLVASMEAAAAKRSTQYPA